MSARRQPAYLIAIALAATVSSGHGFAQSTSRFIQVAAAPSSTGSTDTATPRVGATYVTVEFLASKISQNSNWWTKLIERNRQAVVDVTVSGQFGSSSKFEDLRTSSPIDLKKGTADYDVGWAQPLVVRLPTTYSTLQMRVRISKASKDGLEALLTTMAQLSSGSGMQISQATLGTVSAVKAIADFMFSKHLMEEKLKCTLPFPSSGNSLPAGLYVSFGGDTDAEYAKYLGDAQAGTLAWDGARVTFGGQPVAGVSYFVVRVSYQGRVFDDPLDALSLSTVKPWAALYSIGRGKVATIAQIQEEEKIGAEIRAHLVNGNALLDSDADFIFREREDIKEAVLVNTQKLLVARHNHLAPVNPPRVGSVPAGGMGPAYVTPPPVVILSSPDDAGKTDKLKTLIFEEWKKHEAVPASYEGEEPTKEPDVRERPKPKAEPSMEPKKPSG